MDKKTNIAGLIRLYSRFGFRKLRDVPNTGYIVMERKPKKANKMSIQAISKRLATAGIQHVVVSALGNKNIEAPAGYDNRLEVFRKNVEDLVELYNKKSDFKLQLGSKITVLSGQKYDKVYVIEPHGNKRIYCFINRANGDILKPATATTPAKGARGNVFDDDYGMKRMGPYGPAYNK